MGLKFEGRAGDLITDLKSYKNVGITFSCSEEVNLDNDATFALYNAYRYNTSYRIAFDACKVVEEVVYYIVQFIILSL